MLQAKFTKFAVKYLPLLMVEAIAAVLLSIVEVRGNDIVGGVIDAMLSGELVDFSSFFVLFLILMGAGFVCAFVQKYSACAYANKVSAAYRGCIADKLYRMEYVFFDRNNSASVLNKMSGDISEISDLLEQAFPDVLDCVFALSVYSVYIFRLNYGLFFLMLVLYPVIFTTANRFAKKLNALAAVHRQKTDDMAEITQDAVSGILVLRSFALEEFFLRKMRAAAEALVQNEQKRVRITNNTLVVRKLLQWLPNILCAVYALVLVERGTLTLGALVAFVMVLAKFVEAFVHLPFCYVDAQAGLVSIRRVEEILNAAEETSERKLEAKREHGSDMDIAVDKVKTKESSVEDQTTVPAIEFADVHFGYQAEKEVLCGVNFAVVQGEHIAIIGESGAGKSTVFRLLCGFYQPTVGSIRLFGRELREWELAAARDRIALVSQDIFLFPVSVYENLSFGNREADRAQIEEACGQAEIHAFIMSLPQGYDTVVGERGALLSGGQKQRISIARALLKDAPILLLDEPTSAIDVGTEELIQKALRKVTEGRTCITIAHRLSTIQDSDRILKLSEGKVSEDRLSDGRLSDGRILEDRLSDGENTKKDGIEEKTWNGDVGRLWNERVRGDI